MVLISIFTYYSHVPNLQSGKSDFFELLHEIMSRGSDLQFTSHSVSFSQIHSGENVCHGGQILKNCPPHDTFFSTFHTKVSILD